MKQHKGPSQKGSPREARRLFVVLLVVCALGGCMLDSSAGLEDQGSAAEDASPQDSTSSGTSGMDASSGGGADTLEDNTDQDDANASLIDTGPAPPLDQSISRLHRASTFCVSASMGTVTRDDQVFGLHTQLGATPLGQGQTTGAEGFRLESGLALLHIIPSPPTLCGNGELDPAEACDPGQPAPACERSGWDIGTASCTFECALDIEGCTYAFSELDVISADLACGLRPSELTPSTGSNIVCWPDNTARGGFLLPDLDSTGTPLDIDFQSLAVFRDPLTGIGHACAIAVSGETLCVGDNARNQTTPPAGVLFGSLVAGDGFTCGLDRQGLVACWGDGMSPGLVPASVPYQQLSAAGSKLCGLDMGGFVTCWSAAAGPQPIDFSSVHPDVPPSAVALAIAESGSNICAILDDGFAPLSGDLLACIGSDLNRLVFSTGDSFKGLVASNASVCAITDLGLLTCYTDTTDLNPFDSQPVTAASMQDDNVCALRLDGSAVCTSPLAPPSGPPLPE